MSSDPSVMVRASTGMLWAIKRALTALTPSGWHRLQFDMAQMWGDGPPTATSSRAFTAGSNGRTIAGMTMITPRAPTPTPERKPAWRAACVAYREKRRAGALDHEAHRAAVA